MFLERWMRQGGRQGGQVQKGVDEEEWRASESRSVESKRKRPTKKKTEAIQT